MGSPARLGGALKQETCEVTFSLTCHIAHARNCHTPHTHMYTYATVLRTCGRAEDVVRFVRALLICTLLSTDIMNNINFVTRHFSVLCICSPCVLLRT